MTKIALVGYGKMGKQIAELVQADPAFEITGTFDIDGNIEDINGAKTDAAIEFTTPATVLQNIETLASKKINIVCGTTGWYDKADEVKKIISKYNSGFIYASNFSVGVNIFFQSIKHAASILNKFPQYGTTIEETHHTQKLDKPSGTAIRTAEFILQELKRKNSITSDHANPLENELNIISRRIENVVGNHKVIFDSEADSITLEHNAKSRRGFAEGALLAAEFIKGKKGFYKFEDIFNNLI